MALYQLSSVNIFKSAKNILRIYQVGIHDSKEFTEKIFKEIEETRKEDMPVEMENPYKSEKPKCILCRYNIEPSYKNSRLLSQFVSRYTGKIYGRHITGLCEYKQKKVEKEIKKAQLAALMPQIIKDPNYLEDPDLYDENKPLRPHRF